MQEHVAGVEESGARWERLLEESVDGAQLVFLDAGTCETHVAMVVMQALHYMSAHSEQVCACLTVLGIEALDLHPREFEDTTGQSRWIRAE